MASGSAPISSKVMDFLKIAFACEVTEGQLSALSVLHVNDVYPSDSQGKRYLHHLRVYF